ncbi:hypothetical protein GH714_011895 [Hevea brasiliensis]|uniref:CCHC-type domain-containing protein n=1 Tax=Hevea brasiliensis TaxID=3981 RepID=A0A6A6LTM7_HEVBR|nr:hypothetical protein GH714_011895 [Hevea brasiliensis]
MMDDDTSNDEEIDLGYGAHQGQRRAGRNFQQNCRRDDEFKLKMDIPTFNRDLDIEEPFKKDGDNKFATEKEKGKITQRASGSCGTNTEKSNNKAPIIGGSKGTNSNAPKVSNPYIKPAAIKCYRCNKIGHCSNECLKRTSVNIVERELEEEEEKFCGPDEDDNERKNMSKWKEFM